MHANEWRNRYQEYIHSAAWQAKRKQALSHYGRECQWCGDKKRLQVHHLHYLTVGRERMEDLEVLCPGCHADADIRRARDGERRSAEALYRAQLAGWVSAKCGEHVDADQPGIEEEFNEWLETREE